MARHVVSFAALAAATVSANRVYPLFLQCDPRWGGNAMGTKGNGEDSTICGEGCAMTSLSMALYGLGVTVDGEPASPATFNAWLQGNQGYMCAGGDCNNLVLDAVTRLNSSVVLVGENPKPPAAQIAAGLASGDTIYIAHVHDNGHFVLLTGVAKGGFSVNDPFYNSTVYPYDNITDIIMYNVTAQRPASAAPVIPFNYPLYKQCDARWGNDIMDTETVCDVGCLISSTSMALGGKNLSINGSAANPGTINAWLRTHNGYDGANDFIESSLPALNPSRISWPSDGMHTTNDVPLATIQGYLTAGRPVIAWVRNRTHFVLVTGWDASNADTLYVNDPGFATLTYSYTNDVVGWRLFDMKGCPAPCDA